MKKIRMTMTMSTIGVMLGPKRIVHWCSASRRTTAQYPAVSAINPSV